MKETDSLFIQISDLVDQKIAKYVSGGSSSALQTISGVNVDSDRKINEIVNELSKVFVKKTDFDGRIDDLSLAIQHMVDEVIVEGLDVTAEDPPSTNVNISSGFGGKRGRPCRLEDDKTIEVPLDEYTSVFYITLQSYGQINVRRSKVDTELTLARIVVPKPGTTAVIEDDQDIYNYDAYIVSAKDAYFDANAVFDEDSKAVIKNALGDILAETIYGTINLSENLKILNTQGTLEINSKELLIKDTASNVLSRFDKDGIYIFDAEGYEKAHFTGDDARIGNIVINQDSIQSQNFVSGLLGSGFKIQDNGYAEFKDVLVRGKISSSIFEYNTLSTVGGNVLISHDADKLAEDMTSTSTDLVTDGSVVFAINDIIWLKEGGNSEYMTIAGVTDSSNYTVTRESGGSAVAWQKGTALVNLGQSDDGGIYMTASESNAPYLSVFTHDGSPWSGLTTHLRIGNLNGFLGCSNDLYGIAIGETNKYLKYDSTNGLRVQGSISVSGDNGVINIYDDNSTEVVRLGNLDGFLGYSSSKYGIAIGESTKFLKYNPDDGLSIQGSTVVSAASGARIELFPDSNTGLIAYDNSSNEIFKILVGGTDVGDVILGTLATAYIKWDKSAGTLLCADIQSPDYVANTTGYKLSSATGLEVNTGKILAKALVDYSAGDYLLASSDGEASIAAGGPYYPTYTKAKEVAIGRGGTLRIKFSISGYVGTTHGRIYRNGGAVGTDRTVGSGGSWLEYSEDISGWSSGDLCQLYICVDTDPGSAHCKEFRIYSGAIINEVVTQELTGLE